MSVWFLPNRKKTHFIKATQPTTSDGPIEVGTLWSDTTNNLLKRCTSTSPVTFVSTEGGAGLSDGDYGDITVGGTGTTMTIDDGAVTYAKIQNVSATDRLLGRTSASAGVIEEVVCTDLAQGLLGDATAAAAFDRLAPTTTQGDLIYHNGTDNVRLAKGTAAQALRMNSGATAPEWVTTAAQVDVYTADDTWTKPTGAKVVAVYLIGGGAGGGSGRRGAAGSVRCGGGGGSGGALAYYQWSASLLGATESVIVGTGGTGGAAVAVNDTNGNPGNDGEDSEFGEWLVAEGGDGGSGGTATAGAGGAARVGFPDTLAVYEAAGVGGLVAGGSASTSGGAGSVGGLTGMSGAGGAAGGGITSGNVESAGGVGGGRGNVTAISGHGTALAGGTAGAANGGTGGNGNATTANEPVGGSGGGGGGSNVGGAAGAGGNGGLYGGGGGGGGASDNGNNSGKGGDGANGIVVVITYF